MRDIRYRDAQAFANDSSGILDLKYRPEDLLSHPIPGEIVPTQNLLLRVTKRRRKGAHPSEPFETKYELLGPVNKTCRFRGIL